MLNSCPKYMSEQEWLESVRTRRKLSFRRIKKFAAVIFIIAAPFIAAALLSMLSNNTLEAVRYELKSAKLERASVRIVMISDLHRKKLDETNQQVVDKTALEEPDLIVVNGDMLERDCTDEEVEAFASLLERLTAISPVYFSIGNHDFPAFFSKYEKAQRGEFLLGKERSGVLKRLISTGAHLLERSSEDLIVNGERIRIGGLYAFAYPNPYYTIEQYAPVFDYLEGFCDTDAFTVMLAHRPKCFSTPAENFCWDIDLILSGHTHNGVVALPFGLGAVYASEMFFQKYSRGLYDINGSSLIIGAGIDGYQGVVPRVFNPPEIVTVDILSEG